MRLLICILIICFPLSTFAGDCPHQIYSDSNKEPDFSCPSPGEEALIPKLDLVASVSLLKDTKAPWEGILMDKNRVMILGLRITALRRIRWIETIQFQDKLKLENKFLEDSHKANLDLCTSQRESYKLQVKELREEISDLKAWYRSGPLWFAVGVFTTAMATTAIVTLVK